jgi:hypothetical protein
MEAKRYATLIEYFYHGDEPAGMLMNMIMRGGNSKKRDTPLNVG